MYRKRILAYTEIIDYKVYMNCKYRFRVISGSHILHLPVKSVIVGIKIHYIFDISFKSFHCLFLLSLSYGCIIKQVNREFMPIFLLHIFDLFVHIIAVLSRTYSYFFAENTAEIVVIIITDQERDRLQFLLFILHQTDRLFHPDSGKTGNDGLSVSLAEHPGKIARIHMIRCSKCRQCDILIAGFCL